MSAYAGESFLLLKFVELRVYPIFEIVKLVWISGGKSRQQVIFLCVLVDAFGDYWDEGLRAW